MVSTSPSTVRRCYAICIVTCRSLLSGSSLGGEVGLGGKSASISGFLATAGIFGVSKLGSMTNMERGCNLPAGRAPQEQVDPVTFAFSVEARSQVHSPAGRAPTARRISVRTLINRVETQNHGNKPVMLANGASRQAQYRK